MYLLDTNVVSELRKIRLGKADGHVANWADSMDAADLYLSVITIQELEIGVLLAERSDPRTGTLLRTWLDTSVAPAFADRVLPIDEAVARRAARLHVPDPAPFRDALIAATALEHHLTVVTRNTRDFERFADLDILNPWS